MEEKKYITLTCADILKPADQNLPDFMEMTARKFTHMLYVNVVEKQDELIMDAVQQIGGNTYQDITIDKSKVIEALGKYVAKRVIVEVKQMPGIATVVYYICPICHHTITCTFYNTDLDKVPSDIKEDHKYCSHCGQHLDWADAEEACDD